MLDLPADSPTPFCDSLPALMQIRGATYRALAARTRELDPAGAGVSTGHLANLVSGRNRPTMTALELIAAALGVRAEHFAEYRLAALRRSLDERAVGFQAACERYVELVD